MRNLYLKTHDNWDEQHRQASMTGEERSAEVEIRRDKTAIKRHNCSRPIAVALADGVITADTTVFDYGCGHGADLKYLSSRGIKSHGWDPHFKSRAKKRPADVVNLGFVLNVIEDTSERLKALKNAYALAGKALVVSVRVDKAPASFKEFGDGYLTAKDTFQKLYSQSEFKSYVEETLQKRAQTASLGVVYIFTDDEAESKYIASRAFSRRLEYRTDLIEQFEKDSTARRFVKQANKIGRILRWDEFKGYDKLLESFGSSQRIERLALRAIDPEKFAGSQIQRREDILTYFAMMRLQGLKPPRIGQLESSVRRDIKGIWPKYKDALSEAEQFLFSLGRPEFIKLVCDEVSYGKQLPKDLYLHRSVEDELPSILRVLIFAAHRIVGTFDYDLIKIATDGRAVSFLKYRDFDEDPHPALERSIRVYLPRATYGIREYSESLNPPILHR